MAQKGYIKNSLTKDLGAPEMANMFQGILGASGIMSLYENLACVKVDNNTVRMSSGAYNLSGHLLGIAKGTTEDLTIDSGTSGQNRNDLVVAEFVRNGGGLGVDTLHFTVVKGTSTSGTAADPALTQQDINAAGVTRQEALYRVKVAGTEITAVEKVAGSVSNLNLVDTTVASHVAENAIDAHGVIPACRVFRNLNQSIPNSTPTYINFINELFDTDSIHDNVTNPSRLTCKTAGKYLIQGNVRFGAVSAGRRAMEVRLNGSTLIAYEDLNPVANSEFTTIGLSTTWALNVGDYIELGVYQNSGASLEIIRVDYISPQFSMIKIG